VSEQCFTSPPTQYRLRPHHVLEVMLEGTAAAAPPPSGLATLPSVGAVP